MGRRATVKCQIKAVDMSFDRGLDEHESQKILKEKIEHNLEIHGEDSEYVVSEGFDKEFKDAFKRVVHDKLVLTRAGIGPKKLPARFEFGFEDNEPDDGYDYTRTRDVRWTVGIEFYEISNEEARKRGLTLVEFHNFKNKKEIDKILSRQFRKNLHKPDLP